MFLDPAAFPFVASLEREWRVVRSELEALRTAYFLPWPERFLYGEGWDVFGLRVCGATIEANCALCPRTAELISAVPGVATAGFSSLLAGAHIRPHVGTDDNVLRCHLGLIVPSGCELRVGSATRSWEEGKCLVFDDTVEHEAWNRGASTRVVLLVDFLRPGRMEIRPCPPAVAAVLPTAGSRGRGGAPQA